MWYNDDGRIIHLNAFKTDSPLTLRYKPESRLKKGTYLIIYKSNLKITAFTKNKVIYKTDEDFGKGYALIPVSEVLKGEEIALLLEPRENKTGCIEGAIRLQSKNDFFFTLLVKEKASAVTILAIIYLFLITLKRKSLCLSLFFCFLLLFIITVSPLGQFFFGFLTLKAVLSPLSLIGAVYFIINYLIIAIKRFMC